MSERKLVYKVTIDEITPIENSDNLELARTTGWRVVVQKGEFKVGDTALYFEIDSALSAHDDRFAFLRERCYKKFNVAGKLFDECLRIRTIKLRGQLSQGLLLPVAQFCEVRNKSLGEDCSDVLYVRHYDNVAEKAMREQTPFLAANQKGVFPSFIGSKTDEERCVAKGTIVKTGQDGILIENIKKGDKVTSVDVAEGVEEESVVTGTLISKGTETDSWFRVVTETGKELYITGNSRIWLPDLGCYRRVDELSVGDVLLTDEKEEG